MQTAQPKPFLLVTKRKPTKIVVVFGSNDPQSKSVAETLLTRAHFIVRYAVTDPQSIIAQELQKKGAEIVKVDFNQPSTIEAACAGCHSIFTIQDSLHYSNEISNEEEYRQGKLLADVASQIPTLKHIVLSSFSPSEDLKPPPKKVKKYDPKKNKSKISKKEPLDSDNDLDEYDSSEQEDMEEGESPIETPKKQDQSQISENITSGTESTKMETDEATQNGSNKTMSVGETMDTSKEDESKDVKLFIEEYFRVDKQLPITVVYPCILLDFLFDDKVYSTQMFKSKKKPISNGGSTSNSSTNQGSAPDTTSPNTTAPSSNSTPPTDVSSTPAKEKTDSETVTEKVGSEGETEVEEERGVFKMMFNYHRVPVISYEDLGTLTATILERPVEYLFRRVHLATDHLSTSDMGSAWEQITGKPAVPDVVSVPNRKDVFGAHRASLLEMWGDVPWTAPDLKDSNPPLLGVQGWLKLHKNCEGLF